MRLAVGSYTGVHWVATQVWRDGVVQSVPAAIALAVDFLKSGSVIFSDGVNVADAKWAPLAGESVRLREVKISTSGYVGEDPGQLAAILAVQQMTSSSPAGNPATADITVTRTGDILTLTGTGVRILQPRNWPRPLLRRRACPSNRRRPYPPQARQLPATRRAGDHDPL